MTRCWYCFARVNEPAHAGANGRAEAVCHECERPLGEGPAEPATFVVMAGPRSSGKGIFIAVMIAQLEHYVSKVRPADDGVRARFEEHYRAPLFEQRAMLAPTGSAAAKTAHQRDPLHFVLTRHDGTRHHLVIRDVAGEDLENLDNADRAVKVDRAELRYFRNADAVFFLYDPGALPTVRNFLAGLDAAQVVGGDPIPVLERTVELMRGGNDPRLAVIMAKFDIVQERAEAGHNDYLAAILRNRGAAFQSEASPLAPADDIESELVHEEIRSLLHRLKVNTLLGEVRQAPGEHRFFAVSALGESPPGGRLHTRGIVPFRCLDPLRWVLAGTGMLPARHHEQLVQRDRFGFTVVEPEVPPPPPEPAKPVPTDPPRRERWQRFARVCLLLAVLVAAVLGIAGFQTYNTVDVGAADPVGQARTWAYVTLGALVAVVVVLGLAITAVIGAKPKAVAVLALIAATALPLGAGWAAYHFGTRALATNAASDPELGRALDLLESWHVPLGGLRG